MSADRYLVVTADDFGIGPATSRGILDLAVQGIVTASVLLVNSEFAESAVQEWHEAGQPMELGWHPCLTLDRPILPPERIPTLVTAEGMFYPLGKLMRRIVLGRVKAIEIEAEFQAQWNRFLDLTGNEPSVVNTHHHVQVFSVVGAALRAVLERQSPRPYVRRIREPFRTRWSIPGARLKRSFLNYLGSAEADRQEADGFPGNDCLGGITDPVCLQDPDFFVRWLRLIPGRFVELTCHPGHWDSTLNGRDGTLSDGQLQRRVREYELLNRPVFREAAQASGFRFVTASGLVEAQLGLFSVTA